MGPTREKTSEKSEPIVPRYGEALSGRSGVPGLSVLFYENNEGDGTRACLMVYVRDEHVEAWKKKGWTERTEC